MANNTYFNINDLKDKNIHFIIGSKGYGKTYYKLIKLIKRIKRIKRIKSIENILRDLRKEYIDSITDIKMANDWNEESYPPAYYKTAGMVEFIDYLLKIIKLEESKEKE